MMNSNLSLMPQLPRRASIITTVMLVLAFLAFLDAGYLTITHYSNAIPPCTIGGCEKVLTSAYSVVLGIPTSLWGMLYALMIFFFVLLYRNNPTRKRTMLLMQILGIGFLGSLGLLYLQAFVLQAFCQYCIVFEALILVLFLASIDLWRSTRALWQPPGNSI